MTDIFDYIMIAAFALSGISLVVSVVLFFNFGIPGVIKDMRGTLEKKQIEEIRTKNTGAAQRSSAVNVFEELQQQARPRRADTKRIKVGATTTGNLVSERLQTGGAPPEPEGTQLLPDNDPGTVVLTQTGADSKEFTVEKRLIFVSTSDILR